MWATDFLRPFLAAAVATGVLILIIASLPEGTDSAPRDSPDRGS